MNRMQIGNYFLIAEVTAWRHKNFRFEPDRL